MTDVSPAPVRTSLMAHPLLRVVVVWLATCLFATAPISAQDLGEEAISFASTVSPRDLGPGSEFTIDGTIAIDLSLDAFEDVNGAIIWTFTVDQFEDAAIEDAICSSTTGASCEAEIDDDASSVTFSGEVDDESRSDVTIDVEIRGAIDEELDRDAILFTAETCGTVSVIDSSTNVGPRGRSPLNPATPDPHADCAGVRGAIEVTMLISPTATTEPTATAEPTATIEPTDEPTATTEPTATIEPTDEPTATSEPTAEPSEEPAEGTPALASEAPQPALEDDDDSIAGLWIGAGSLLVLAAAIGVVMRQRRKTMA